MSPVNYSRVQEFDTCEACMLTDDGDCAEDCDCQACLDWQEAEKDREFDEQLAFGYFL